ncbi:DUF1275 domain-containing protein [Pelagicoccus sp. NFK12]|uniref:DUF1275 domain-containing protein n=1 Tax=Pelagicoccus enzymogenes TaxID=2773457 RepID=A0A927F6C5_9BACT|nr:YoaK family protein [Pelagicoccus enzymogenes]MBD5779243.1 DUF1275 domain-containing protein [Pelagicoccus enzymogenes]MDQ8198404.1 YoaK family protein [Pelagicoccus enzymogenes]
MHQVPPRYVLLGGCILAFGAAFVNVGFLLNTGASASHLTGDISRLAADFASVDAVHRHSFYLVCMATLGFVLGALVSGMLLHHPQLELAKPYGRIVSGIGILLVAAYLVASASEVFAIGIAGFACGLQNALATKYRGLVLRTTHMTGLLTDLGVMTGMWIRGHRLEIWRMMVPLFLCLSFFVGSLIGAFAVLKYDLPWLAVAGGAYFFGGLVWSVVKRRLKEA